MIREIMHDPIFLAQKSVSPDGSPADLAAADDLRDTLTENRDRCVGMAANMIGVGKRIIVFFDGSLLCEMFDPEITAKSGPYEAEEGCLSLSGTRKTTRYQKITVRFRTRSGQVRTKTYTGWTAQIIQHEIDHCNGILI